MSKTIHMTAADTVKMLKITQSQSHPSEAAVIAGRREPYHLTYIKKYGHAGRDGIAESQSGERDGGTGGFV